MKKGNEQSFQSQSHWQHYHQNWSLLTPPLRPHAEAVEAMQALLGPQRTRVLLLGVTPELADIGDSLLAVDRNPGMLSAIWPGDTSRRKACLGDWFDLDPAGQKFSAVTGDGCLSAMRFPEDYQRLVDSLLPRLEPGGVIIFRVYLAPDTSESLDDLQRTAWASSVKLFHAFKLRLAMALAATRPQTNLPVTAIRDAFDSLFPDRVALAAATGWPAEQIATIDRYANSGEVYSFPTRDQLLSILPKSLTEIIWVKSGSYELAERCPLLLLRN